MWFQKSWEFCFVIIFHNFIKLSTEQFLESIYALNSVTGNSVYKLSLKEVTDFDSKVNIIKNI